MLYSLRCQKSFSSGRTVCFVDKMRCQDQKAALHVCIYKSTHRVLTITTASGSRSSSKNRREENCDVESLCWRLCRIAVAVERMLNRTGE